MSQAHHQSLNVLSAGIDGHPYPPESALAQTPQSVSNFVDGSGPIFSMYLEMATEEDKKMVENWKADADGILIFTGLFSAAVASLISVSIQDIRQDPQDTSNFYLANIYQTLADPNRPNISSSLPASPPPFSPPNYAVWVNALWFLSLVISLTCALLATLLQQWARRYLKVTQPRYAPHKRARIRAFLFEGVDKLLLPWTVEVLPTLLHISLFLFFAGLVVFLSNVDLTIFKFVLSWISICMALYGCITVMPIIRHDSPYLTPFSLPAWHIVTGISFLTFRVLRRLPRLRRFTHDRFVDLAERYGRWLVQGMQKTVEETAFNSPSEVDTRAFLWTLDSSDEDHELERFFSGLPGFRNSKVVRDPLPGLAEERKRELFTTLTGLLDRTFSSHLLPEPVKTRRAIICMKAVDPAHTPEAWVVLNRVLSKYQYSDHHPLAAEIWLIVRDWVFDIDTLDAKATFSKIVARVQPRDDYWFFIASEWLGVPEDVLRDYAAHGDSLSLAILTHVTRQQFSYFRSSSWQRYKFSEVLKEASKFDVSNTSSRLQHDFCALWNQIARKAQNDGDLDMAFYSLGRIRNVYLALHQGTNSAPTRFSASTGEWDNILRRPSSYPICNVPGHHPDLTYIHNNSTSTPFMHAVLRDNPTPPPASLHSIPHAPRPSSSLHPPLYGEENFVDVPLLNDNMSVSASLYPAHQTAMGNPRSPGCRASPAPVAADATRDIETSPPDTVAVDHTADGHAPLDNLDVPSSPSPTPVLEGILSTDPLLCPDSSMAVFCT